MIHVGVDPGKQGAIAIHGGGEPRVVPMPLIRARVVNGKKKGRDEYDLVDIAMLLSQELEGIGTHEILVTVEKSQPMPPKMPGGGIANYHRGVSRGFEWMLVGLGMPYQLVAPQTWQKVMHVGTPAGDTKVRSIVAAKRLFPNVSLRRTAKTRKDEDGMAEALLLAEYGRRTATNRLEVSA